MRLRHLAAVAALAGLSATGLITAEAAGPVLPRPTPALSLPDAAGATVSLASRTGRVVLVDFWASWCAPCKVAFPAYDALHREFADRGFDVLAVNVDEERKAADAFLAGRRYSVTVLFDPKGTSPAAFKLTGMPTSYLVDRKGVVRFAHEGFHPTTIGEYRREIELLLQETP